jgi:HSP20 family protein
VISLPSFRRAHNFYIQKKPKHLYTPKNSQASSTTMIVITPQHPFNFQRGPCFSPCALGLASAPNCAPSNDETKPTTTNEKDKADATPKGSVYVERTPIHQEETPDAATISLDVTGFTADNLTVQVEDHVVSVSGRRANRLGDTYVIRRRFRVDKSTVDQEQIRAKLSDGVLEIVVPKKPVSGPRVIPISTTESDAGLTASAGSKSSSASTAESKDASPDTPATETQKKDHATDATAAEKSKDAVDEKGQVSVEVETVDEDGAAEATVDTTQDEEAWQDVAQHA